MINSDSLLSQKDLAARWRCSIRTVRRHVREFNARVKMMTGSIPLFELDEVKRLERERQKARLAKIGLPGMDEGILTLKQLKRRAKR